MPRYILAITGASGMPYAVRLFQNLIEYRSHEIYVIISKSARYIMELESDIDLNFFQSKATGFYFEDNLKAPFASGSWIHQGMVVCPCSMATLACISQGFGSNLIHRSADVSLKEKRPLILVPRETPLHSIHLQNMLQAAQAGATILPPCPGFYYQPKTIEDLVSHFVGRILDHLKITNTLVNRWGESF